MTENLGDYLDERSKQFQDEKQKQLDVVNKMREAAKAEKEKFIGAITKVVKPKMAELLKKFSEKNHTLTISREDLNSTTPNIKYSLTMDEPGKPIYLIEFDSNISEVEVSFSFFKHNAHAKSYDKSFTYELTKEEVENEVINGLKKFKNQ